MNEPTANPNEALVGLGARVHIFVRPERRKAFATLFHDVLGCEVLERDFGMKWPILLVRFGDGSSFSVEVSELAPEEDAGRDLDDAAAFRGAWVEFRTRDKAAVEEKLRRAAIRHFQHPGSPHTYFSAPGGQVFRIIDVAYQGP